MLLIGWVWPGAAGGRNAASGGVRMARAAVCEVQAAVLERTGAFECQKFTLPVSENAPKRGNFPKRRCRGMDIEVDHWFSFGWCVPCRGVEPRTMPYRASILGTVRSIWNTTAQKNRWPGGHHSPTGHLKRPRPDKAMKLPNNNHRPRRCSRKD